MSKATGELTMKESLAIPLFKFDGLIAWLIFVFIALFVVLGIAQLQAPAALPANAPATEFSAARAMPHLTAIAQKPHPMGEPAHTEVRDYLVKQLGDLGMRVEIQQTTSVNSRNRAPFLAGTVQNVVGRLEGTANTRAIMLAAHYDSALTSPGANDNGTAVAALLETVRALKAGPQLHNDLIVLFTDGEEAGILGSKAFVEEHPWAKDVGLVLNLEARGNTGPVLLFETSRQNGRLIREFAEAAPYPFASSLFADLYRVLPNDTDFTEFRIGGMPGLNFAYVDGYLHYHTATDSIESVDQRSVQHHGSYALALTRHFGGLDLSNLNARDEVFFNIFGSTFVHYSTAWVTPLALLVLVVFVAVVVIGFRRKQLTFSGILGSFFAFLACLLIISHMGLLLWMIIRALHPQYASLPHGETYNSSVYKIGFTAIILALTTMAYQLFGRKISLPNLVVGSLTWWLIFTLLSSFLLPGSSYLFVWPLLFTLIGLGIIFRDKQPANALTKRFGLLLLCAIPGLLLFPPLIYLAFISLTLRVPTIPLAIFVLWSGTLIPLLRLMTAPKRWLMPGAALLIGLGFLGAGSMTSGYDANNPKPNDIMYALNADTGKAVWASAEVAQDSWTGQFFPNGGQRELLSDFFPTSAMQVLQTEAPVVPLAAPNVALIDDTTTGELRKVRLRITTPPEAQLAFVWVDPNTEVVGSLVDGKRVPNNQPARPGVPWGMIYSAPPREGVELTLEVKPGQPLKIRAVGRIAGVPQVPGMTVTPRPPEMMPPPSLGTISQYSDATVVVKSFVFEPPATASSK